MFFENSNWRSYLNKLIFCWFHTRTILLVAKILILFISFVWDQQEIQLYSLCISEPPLSTNANDKWKWMCEQKPYPASIHKHFILDRAYSTLFYLDLNAHIFACGGICHFCASPSEASFSLQLHLNVNVRNIIGLFHFYSICIQWNWTYWGEMFNYQSIIIFSFDICSILNQSSDGSGSKWNFMLMAIRLHAR